MEHITVSTPAKINLGLWVGKKRPDGFHEIVTILVPLAFGDQIKVTRTKSEITLRVTGIKLPIPPEQNLAFQAAQRFFRETKINAGCRIEITKRIPPGSGMAGGSSNAASVLLALNRIFGCPLPPPALKKLALGLGSDVPFFLQQTACVARGRGEKLRPVNLPALNFFLHYPGFGIATAWAYRELDRQRRKLTPPPFSPKILLQKLRRDELAGVAELLFNSFEAVVFPRYPELKRAKTQLLKCGAYAASLSGSGSTVYALIPALDPMAELRSCGLPGILTRSRPTVRRRH